MSTFALCTECSTLGGHSDDCPRVAKTRRFRAAIPVDIYIFAASDGGVGIDIYDQHADRSKAFPFQAFRASSVEKALEALTPYHPEEIPA